MNSDEYHMVYSTETEYDLCRFCGLPWGDHEFACPYQPKGDDDPVYTQLKEPWTETP